MLEIIKIAAEICGSLSTIAALAVLFIKPLRERVLGMKKVMDGQKCLLRADMLRTYYKHKDSEKIRQYEYENFLTTYDAYKALGGNSFIEHIYSEVTEWEVET
ncbi:MAG: hypothetical protein IKB44_02540 [Clostridia bacterium]|nr:hypothetical protein [Clostridia bacterium]